MGDEASDRAALRAAFQTMVNGYLAKDPKALRRGIQSVRVCPEDWERFGCPLGVRVLGVTVPVEPLGTRPGHVAWYYRKRPRAAFTPPATSGRR